MNLGVDRINMQIIRCLDTQGYISYGTFAADGQVLRLIGEFFNELIPDGSSIQVSKLLAPIVPSNIFCIGLNYADHAAETGASIPEFPVVFMKPTSAINHPGCAIPIPNCCTHGPEVDFEAELAVVIGKAARNVKEAHALDYVFGYTAANDISARKWQKHGGGGQWIRGKGFDGFCPLGPVLVTADAISNPNALRIRTVLNGIIMQDGNTADMLFSVARLISLLSQDTTLLPGTVILTGTPSGVGFTRKPPVFLQPGDNVVIEIDGIGRLENVIVAS